MNHLVWPTGIVVAALTLWCVTESWAGHTAAIRPPAVGFLSSTRLPDVIRIVPAAPATDDRRFAADMAVYRATRAMRDSPRWILAQSDDDVTTAGLFKAFRCALGANLSPENAPLVTTLVIRANADSSRASNVLKRFYQHKRPYLVVDGPVCVTPETKATLSRDPDYPSGHSTAAWETGLVMSAVAPDRTTAILTRARAYGESRIVCGVHSLSAVEAGWMTATSVFAAQQGSDDFQQTVKAAKAEFAAIHDAASVDPAVCAAETALLARDPF
jgi:acid phosphatase (class A)